MKVLDLQCRQGHSFEGWFGSQDDYDAQRARGLVACPVCNDNEITKMLSAPRLNLGHAQAPAMAAPPSDAAAPAADRPGERETSPAEHPQTSAMPVDAQTRQQMQAAMLKMVRHVLAHTEDVGDSFAEEARKIHYGERETRNIRGQATPEETEALLDEGIDVLPLPVPDALKKPMH